MTSSDLLLTLLISLMALLYASVGHAGSSGYQAAMALMGVSAAMMKPTALFLNVVVASIGTWQFASTGHINWRQWFWLVVASVPMAYIGGYFTLPPGWYYLLVAVVLWLAAIRLWFSGKEPEGVSPRSTATSTLNHPLQLLVIGGILGFLSGLTGTGGGIFLTPLLVLGGWATPRQAAGISVAFILANSPAALLGWWLKQKSDIALPNLLPVWMILVAGCGWLGAWFGSKYGSPLLLRRLLALVLVIAGAKLALSGLQ
jgi:uncharacterized protein